MYKPKLSELVSKLRELEYMDVKAAKSPTYDPAEIMSNMIEDIRDIRIDLQLLILEQAGKEKEITFEPDDSLW